MNWNLSLIVRIYQNWMKKI